MEASDRANTKTNLRKRHTNLMSKLEEMIVHTKQLHQLFIDKHQVTDREQVIQDIHVLLDRRAEILPYIGKPMTEVEKKQAAELTQLNEHVKHQMDEFFQQLKKEIQTNKLQKKSNRSYTNPYKHVQVVDGMFVDQKN